MTTPVPTLPTTLPDVEVAAGTRAGVPVVVLCRTPDGDGPVPLGPGAADLPAAWVEAVGLTGARGEVRDGPVGSSVRWVVGVGACEPEHWRTAGAALARAVHQRLATLADAGTDPGPDQAVQVELPAQDAAIPADDEAIAQFARGLRLGGYRFTVSRAATPPGLRTARLVVSEKDRRERIAAELARSAAPAAATAFARDLANTPSNVKDPAWLARTAARAAAKVPGLTAHVRDERWLAEQGFGGVLAVGAGSTRPPRLLHLDWSPADAEGPHLGLVGKGITFDTGGISIKPADGMHLMRTDMAGGAAVIAATIAVARLGLPVRVSALVPCAENHVSGSSYRPGDVVRHYGGRTTEVSNTDAEGRMVLADGLVYAREALGVDVLVDVATLTGAMKVSLGLRIGGLFASDDDLAARITDAGAAAGERWWRMPLLDQYAAEVPSDIADVRQCPPGPGAITAALFLREFTGDLPWAHLDIAGPARADRVYDEVVPGATGFAARTLVELVASYAG
ncbi:leucyl aminopeptidase family protein [Actinokineospora enzanensis]|uniref:leucyl aminopeptidase family protein n=1 Tax=Actinokineospora enzanensis TaxID=155975 RepID=UPI0003819E55|nr:leucyl aminopeptidase family protein [Actinokineospora enzanensis]